LKFLNNKRRLILFILIGIISATSNIKTNKNNEMEVLFVYNAKSGLFNALTDYVHRQISPSTYSCNLCLITYDNWDRNQQWANYIESLPISVNFTYADVLTQYQKRGEKVKLPIALLKKGKAESTFMTVEEINSCNDDEALIMMFDEKLKNLGIIE
jgi:hypothetical protein